MNEFMKKLIEKSIEGEKSLMGAALEMMSLDGYDDLREYLLEIYDVPQNIAEGFDLLAQDQEDYSLVRFH